MRRTLAIAILLAGSAVAHEFDNLKSAYEATGDKETLKEASCEEFNKNCKGDSGFLNTLKGVLCEKMGLFCADKSSGEHQKKGNELKKEDPPKSQESSDAPEGEKGA